MGMKIYGHPMSTCTRKILMTLAEKGSEAEFVMVDLMTGAHKQADHMARHPFGVVPVFEDDGFQIYESRAIIRYLDAKLSGPKLTPTDLHAFARMEQWMSVEQSYFTPNAMKVVMEAMFGPMRGQTPRPEVIQQGIADASKALDVLDKGLEGNEYLAGSFSLADIDYAPYMEYFVAAGGGDAVGSRSNVAAWWKRLSARPSWQLASGKTKSAS